MLNSIFYDVKVEQRNIINLCPPIIYQISEIIYILVVRIITQFCKFISIEKNELLNIVKIEDNLN